MQGVHKFWKKKKSDNLVQLLKEEQIKRFTPVYANHLTQDPLEMSADDYTSTKRVKKVKGKGNTNGK